jgi:hypothetical protein
MKHRVHTRREFLKGTASAAIGGALYLGAPVELLAQSEKKTRVVLIRDKDVLDSLNKPRQDVVRRMLDEAVTTLVGEKDPLSCWKKLIKPTDTVGIKSNVWHLLPTPKELEVAIEERIRDAGVSSKNVGIDDRGVRDNPIFKNATALINVRPMRTHHWSGVGTMIKNYIIYLRMPWTIHGDTCADLAEIWKRKEIAGKTRLNILVLFTPLFHGTGPHHFNPKYTWGYKGMIVGFDPVAVDSTGLRILLAKRREFFDEDRPLSPPPKHIFLADTRHHLGTANPHKIEVIKLGWEKDILI